MKNNDEAAGTGIRPDREYNAVDSAAAHEPFVKIIGYVFLGHTFGLLSSIAVHQQFGIIEGVQEVMLTSGLIYAIGLIPTDDNGNIPCTVFATLGTPHRYGLG